MQVDVASGAASMEIPFGPGIGGRGLNFRPTLSMRIAPQLGISSRVEQIFHMTLASGYQIWIPQTVDELYQRSFGSATFSPGTYSLGLYTQHEIGVDPDNYSFPGGGGSTSSGSVSTITLTEAQSLLQKFNLGSEQIANIQGYVSSSTTPFIRVGSTGHLILGLKSLSAPDFPPPGNQNLFGFTDEIHDDVQENTPITADIQFPRRILVVQGEVAYLYTYFSHGYLTNDRSYLINQNRSFLNKANYALTRILNRFGESIDFRYETDGIGYTATWSTNREVKIIVSMSEATLSPSGKPSFTRPDIPMTAGSRINIHYTGTATPVSAYELDFGFAGDPLFRQEALAAPKP
ncbi:MAG: hypothetical protein IPN59_12420 [Holophaga sp.]|nr:hypothetical protein [Holophaga sp.]